MFGFRNSNSVLNKTIEDLMSRALECSEENGRLKAVNESLKEKNVLLEYECRNLEEKNQELESKIRTLKNDKEEMLSAARTWRSATAFG